MFSFWNAPEYWVYFKAFMSDDFSSNRFGLRIIGYLFPNHSTDLTLKYVQVGECKSRKLKAGKLTIQLRSGLFEADESVGEYPGILSKTVDFEGVDFDVDFACVFKCKNAPKVFGKVEIKPAGCKDGHGISFNLMKSSGCNINQISQDKGSLMDLLKSHHLDGNIWKELALSLNYSRPEVDTKFSSYSEPVEEILTDYVNKGGKMNEFFKAMIKVAKIFKIHPLGELNKKMDESAQDIPESCLSEERTGSKRKFEYCNELFTESKLDDIASAITSSWRKIGRKLHLSELDLREIDLNYCNCGEREKAFQMLITWRERDPENCVPEKLFSILKESGLKHTALKLSQYV